VCFHDNFGFIEKLHFSNFIGNTNHLELAQEVKYSLTTSRNGITGGNYIPADNVRLLPRPRRSFHCHKLPNRGESSLRSQRLENNWRSNLPRHKHRQKQRSAGTEVNPQQHGRFFTLKNLDLSMHYEVFGQPLEKWQHYNCSFVPSEVGSDVTLYNGRKLFRL
jgi:hypothetical protein